jgi:hypothetical protein
MVIGVVTLGNSGLIMATGVGPSTEDQHALPVRVRACEAPGWILE